MSNSTAQQPKNQTLTLEQEKQLVAQAIQDQAAFGKLFNFYIEPIYIFVYQKTGDQETSEELVSQIFHETFLNLHKFPKQEISFGAWLYRIVNKYLLKYAKDLFPEDQRKNLYVYIDPNQDLTKEQIDLLKLKMEDYLLKLPEKYQELLNLKFFAGLSNQDIALIMGQSLKQTEIELYESFIKLKKLIPKNELLDY